MKKAVPFGHEKGAIIGRRSYDKRSANSASALMEKPNRCMIVPSNVEMTAEAIERKDTNWFVRTNAPNDLIIQIDKKHCFHLHILPMVSRSAYLNRLIFEKRNNNNGVRNTTLNIELNNLPGGAETFELIVKFCYGWKLDLSANNVSHLYCAANFLEMVDGLENRNLVSKTESFLSFIIFSSWKDTFIVLKTSETISSSAREFHVQRRCSEAIAWKIICTYTNESQCYGFSMENDIDYPFPKQGSENWWFEDVGSLRIDHFIEVVACLRKKGLKSDVLGSCITYWTAKWVSRVCIGIRVPTQKGVSVTVNQVRKVTVESLIRVLPTEENSVPCNFLLHLLKLGLMTKVETSLCSKLSKRIASMLERCQPSDLLVKNYGESEALFDVGIIARVVETYVSLASRNPLLKLFVVGRLVDGFLVLVARDTNLLPDDFRVLAESLPKNARYSDDTLYRAIDRFLKAHPNMTEEERKGICRVMEYNKLSEEAREHAMKNERLPLNTTTQFMLLEQVKMMKPVVESGSSIYRRTKAQMIINVKADSRRECKQVVKKTRNVKHEIETIKSELSRLHACRVQIKRLARKLW
ncbi:hypothetical protein RND81_09G225800 [Saponaria officinalis]|uniref:Phototropic-responsive NPH3 family protein n=1 Tax=Saponaria officinalis TaxID=3572 RepID=A0AAW1IR29_SAPOF